MYSADAIANEFLELAAKEGKPVTPLMLQKLVYYAHGWHLGLGLGPLIDEPIEAWKLGPVIRSLYAEFRKFGGKPITEPAHDIKFVPGEGVTHIVPRMDCEGDSGAESKDVIDRVWGFYKQFSGLQLSTMTHEPGSPWHQVASSFSTRIPEYTRIPNAMLQEHFAKRIETEG